MGKVIDAGSLRAVREAKGWDQRTLAERAGIDPSVVSRLERGLQLDLRASVLVALARALDTTIDSLLAAPYQRSHPPMIPELAAVMTEVAELPEAHQHQVAAILRAYLT